MADLQKKLSILRKFQHLSVRHRLLWLGNRRSYGAQVAGLEVTAKPEVSILVHEETMLQYWPIRQKSRPAPRLQNIALRIELNQGGSWNAAFAGGRSNRRA